PPALLRHLRPAKRAPLSPSSYRDAHPRAPHSFPTRRSSDLFGGVHPEPIEPHIEALRQAVLAGKYDAGFCADGDGDRIGAIDRTDRKSTRLNSSHGSISYAVFCLKKKIKETDLPREALHPTQ